MGASLEVPVANIWGILDCHLDVPLASLSYVHPSVPNYDTWATIFPA